MKTNIAILGHSIRGKEIIQIFENLGGKNKACLTGKSNYYYYINHNDNRIECHNDSYVNEHCKKYTLKEFEEKFPFKVGDKVITNNDRIGVIEKLILEDISGYYIKTNNGNYWCNSSSLRLYKEMEEKRNILITIHKAKEWYNEGGELRKIALQAYSEEELTEIKLPESWQEYCNNYPKQKHETYIGIFSTIESYNKISDRHHIQDKNTCPSEKSAEAHLALSQLEQLRDCYRQGDIPDFTKQTDKYSIGKVREHLIIINSYYSSYFLSFTKKEVAEEFLTNFEPLIKIAEDYI